MRLNAEGPCWLQAEAASMQSHRRTSFVLIGRGFGEEHRDCDEVNLGSSRSSKLAVPADSFWLLEVLVGSNLETQQVLCLQPWSRQKNCA